MITINQPEWAGCRPPGHYYFRLPEDEQIALFKEWFARAAGERIIFISECHDYTPPAWTAW